MDRILPGHDDPATRSASCHTCQAAVSREVGPCCLPFLGLRSAAAAAVASESTLHECLREQGRIWHQSHQQSNPVWDVHNYNRDGDAAPMTTVVELDTREAEAEQHWQRITEKQLRDAVNGWRRHTERGPPTRTRSMDKCYVLTRNMKEHKAFPI